jgi:hypothetical protein
MAKRGNPIKSSLSQKKTRQEFCIDVEQIKYLDEIASSTNITKADIVRRALSLWISQNSLDEFIKANSK